MANENEYSTNIYRQVCIPQFPTFSINLKEAMFFLPIRNVGYSFGLCPAHRADRKWARGHFSQTAVKTG